jgi:P-type conjugative transfer protein TrbG
MGAFTFRTEAISRGARMLRTALGPAIAAWLEDPGVVEVMLNPDGRLWVDRLTTPYQRAAQVWDERIGSARVQARNWRLIAFGNLGLVAGLAAGLVWQSAQSTVVPWVVQVDKLGEAQAVAPAIADYKPADPQIAWHLARFIEQVRSVPADPVIVRQNWLGAYDFTTDKGAAAHPTDRVAKANEAARVQPTRNGYINAVQVYPYATGALYQVYTAPGQVTDIALQEGEQLVGSGPVAAGDTVRWIIGDTESGTGQTKRVHIEVKPTRPDLVTNLVINTDRRTYHLELRSTEKAYMASVSWQYPQDQLIALRRYNAVAEAAAPIDTALDLGRLNFRYAIEGDTPAWRPLRAFDDGAKVFIEFPRGIRQGEMPPLFVLGPEGGAELVNYRARQNYYVVDRLFAAAELRLGDDHQQKVRIVRTDGRPRW